MEILINEKPLRFDSPFVRFDYIQEKYGDNYPIILFESNIHCQEKKDLRDIIQGNSSLHVFSDFKRASKFVRSLRVSFILLVSQSESMDENPVLQNFRSLENTCCRSMLDFEEEALLKDLFQDISEQKMESLRLKAYVFVTWFELKTENPMKEGEEEVMIIPNVKEMTEKFRQEYVIIWYDPCISLGDKEALEQKLDIEERNIYDKFEELKKRIHNSGEPPFHLILTGKNEAEEITKKAKELKSLLGIYIYCSDPDLAIVKGRNIFVDKGLKALIPRIREGVRTKSALTNSFPAFATDFDAADKSQIYNLHYYLRGLINFKNRKQAQRDFLQLAKGIYQSKKIFEFEQEYDGYNKKKILEWYTKETPVYKLVNNCLRIATSDSILYCRYVLKDLETAIREEYREESHKFNGLVYRGAYIKTEELEKLENNIGKEIEMYGFLSTSQNIETAKNFVCSDFRNKILITIIVPPLPAPELNEQGFAKIDQGSSYQEAEILFNVRSKFTIVETGMIKIKINDQGKECRHLVLMYGAQLLRKYMTKSQPVISLELKLPPEVKCNLCGSVKELFGFQQDTTEVRCLECLQKTSVPQGIPLLALDFENKTEKKEKNGVIAKSLKGQFLAFNQAVDFPYHGYKCCHCQGMGKAKYYKWLSGNKEEIFQQCSDCFMEKGKVGCPILVNETNPYLIWQDHQAELETVEVDYQVEVSTLVKGRDQSDVYLSVREHELCLEYNRKVIKSLTRIRRREHRKLKSFFDMGKANEGNGKYQKAIEFYEKVRDLSKVRYEQDNLCFAYNSLACAYRGLGQYQRALKYFTNAINLSETIYQFEHPITATLYNNVVFVHRVLGQFQEALECASKALKIRKVIFGDKHPETASSYKDYAVACHSLGQYQKALEFHQKALNIRKAIFGDKNSDTVISYSSYAETCASLGKYQEALENHKKALDIKIDIFGDKRPETAISYHNIAVIYNTLGKYQEAMEYFQKAMNIVEACNQEKHPENATLYSNYADICDKMGKHQEALEYHNKALGIKPDVFGDDGLDRAAIYSNYAKTCQSFGKYEVALEYHNKALEIIKNKVGEKHSKTAFSYYNIALMYESCGKYPEAFAYSAKALDISTKFFGDKHPETAVYYDTYGSVCQRLKKYQKALESHKKALDISIALSGENYFKIAAYYTHYGSICETLGKHEEAFRSHKKALDIAKTVFGKNHPETAPFYSGYASICRLSGKHEKELKYFAKALNLKKTKYGDNHTETAISYNNYGLACQDNGKYEEALESHKKAVDLVKDRKDKQFEAATFFCNYGLVYEALGKYENASECYQKALDISKNVFGDRHPEHVFFCNNYGGICEVLGNHEKALEFLKKALDISKKVFGDEHPNTVTFYNNYTFLQKKH